MNWILVVGGLLCVIVESALGAITGLDLALVGASLAIGSAIGLTTSSPIVGLLGAGGLSLAYLAVFRSWLIAKFKAKNQVSNVDAALIIRLGKYHGMAPSGLTFIVAFINGIVCVDMREQVISVPSQN